MCHVHIEFDQFNRIFCLSLQLGWLRQIRLFWRLRLLDMSDFVFLLYYMNNVISMSTTDGRITRGQYAALFGIYILLLVVAVLVSKVLAFIGGLICMTAFGVMIMGAVRRSHDCGRSGWFLLIPFYNLWLLFEPGYAGDNRYGPDPRQTVVTRP